MPAKKKTAAKKSPAKKKPASKAAPAKKKSALKKTAARKKAPAKKSAAKTTGRTPKSTTITAQVDVGFGNKLYLRGEGGGLNWDEGVLMENRDSNEWTWSTTGASDGMVFKFLINDELWSLGEDLTVPAGGTSMTTPRF